MKLIDLMEVIHSDSFISVRWQHNTDYDYQGLKCDYSQYAADPDIVIRSVEGDPTMGIILVIDTEEEKT